MCEELKPGSEPVKESVSLRAQLAEREIDRLRAEVEALKKERDAYMKETHHFAEQSDKWFSKYNQKDDDSKALEAAERSALALAAENGELRGAMTTDILSIQMSSNILCEWLDFKRPDARTRVRLTMNDNAIAELRAFLSRPPSFWTRKVEAMEKVAENVRGLFALSSALVSVRGKSWGYDDVHTNMKSISDSLAALDSVGEDGK